MSLDRQEQAAQAAVVKPRGLCCPVKGVLMAHELCAGHGEGLRSLWTNWILFAPCLYLKICITLMQMDLHWCLSSWEKWWGKLEEKLARSNRRWWLCCKGTWGKWCWSAGISALNFLPPCLRGWNICLLYSSGQKREVSGSNLPTCKVEWYVYRSLCAGRLAFRNYGLITPVGAYSGLYCI